MHLNADKKIIKLLGLIFLGLGMVISFQNCGFTGQMQALQVSSSQSGGPKQILAEGGEPYEGKGYLSFEKLFLISSLPTMASLDGESFARSYRAQICSDGGSKDFQSLVIQQTNWLYSSTQCLVDQVQDRVGDVRWSQLLHELAAYKGQIYQRQSLQRNSHAIAMCEYNSAAGSLVLEVSKNEVFPELPKYRAAELNFYLKELPPDMQFSRSDSSAGVASFVSDRGLISYSENDQPRFDHDPMTREFLGLLIEGRAINHVASSHQLEVGSSLPWQIDAWTSPDGTSTAEVLELSQTSEQVTVASVDTSAINTSEDLSFSFFVKVQGVAAGDALSLSWIQTDDSGARTRNFQINSTGGVVDQNPSWIQTRQFNDGWIRVELQSRNYTKDESVLTLSTSATSGSVSFWGLQLEENSFATSYIKTSGVPQSRGDDLADWSTAGWLKSDIGTFLFEWSIYSNNPKTDQHIFVGSSSADVTVETSTSGRYNVFVGTTRALDRIAAQPNSQYRSAASYSGNALVGVHNGALTEGPGVPPLVTGSSYQLGRDDRYPGEFLYGHIKRVSYWDKTLEAEQLVDMTSAQRYQSPYSGVMRLTGFGLTDPDEGVETTLISVVANGAEGFSSYNYNFELNFADQTSRLQTDVQSTPLTLNLSCIVDR